MYFVYFTIFLCKSVVWIAILLLLCRQLLPLVCPTATKAERMICQMTDPLWLLGIWLCRMLGVRLYKEGIDGAVIAAEILLGWMLLCLALTGTR